MTKGPSCERVHPMRTPQVTNSEDQMDAWRQGQWQFIANKSTLYKDEQKWEYPNEKSEKERQEKTV